MTCHRFSCALVAGCLPFQNPLKYAVFALFVAYVVGAVSCSEPVSPVDEAPAVALEKGVVATVGTDVVTVEQLNKLCEVTGDTPRVAANKLIYDALFAQAALQANYKNRPDIVVQYRALLSRVVLDELKQRSENEPISDDEVQQYTKRHWMEMERPVSRQTVHAVVVVEPTADTDIQARAESVAQDIAEAVAGITEGKAFISVAKKVNAQGLKVIVESLPPVTRDGRVVDLSVRGTDEPQRFDAAFVKHVFSLVSEKQQTKPFRSPFGIHVVLYEKQLEPVELSFEQRKRMLTPEIQAHRVRAMLDALLAQLRQKNAVVVQRNADAILDLLNEPLSDQVSDEGR